MVVTLGVVADSAMRDLFARPILGMRDMCGVVLPWIIASGFTYALITERHVRVTVVVRLMSRTLRSWLNVVVNVIGLIVFIFYSFIAWQMFWESMLVREAPMGPVATPVYIGKLALWIGTSLLAIEFALRLIKSLREKL